MLELLRKKEIVSSKDIESLENSRRFIQVDIESKDGQETYSVVDASFNGYGFTFILNVDKSNFNAIKDVLILIKDRNKRNKVKFSKRYFFIANIPSAVDVSIGEQKIEIFLIKENFNYITGYSTIYRCKFFGNYPYDQKVFCENLYDLPLVFRKFIENNQNKPENLVEFFTKPEGGKHA